jgi:hypothetical protein
MVDEIKVLQRLVVDGEEVVRVVNGRVVAPSLELAVLQDSRLDGCSRGGPAPCQRLSLGMIVMQTDSSWPRAESASDSSSSTASMMSGAGLMAAGAGASPGAGFVVGGEDIPKGLAGCGGEDVKGKSWRRGTTESLGF